MIAVFALYIQKRNLLKLCALSSRRKKKKVV